METVQLTILDVVIMENKSPLFRQEVINNRIYRSLGTIRINVPLNFQIAGYCAMGILFILMVFLLCAQISERIFIRGYLDTKSGIISVESDVSGIIDEVAVEEGMFVREGEKLFVISTSNKTNSQHQMNNIKQRIENLRREYQIQADYHHALQKLYNKNYISASGLKNSEANLLELKNKLKTAEYELLKFKENQTRQIKAPSAGTVTNIFYRRGQSVQPGKPLLQIIPDETDLIARLYIPSRSVGFLKAGQTVHLKYDAYPSQRFGFYEATIAEINQTILTDNKEDKPIHVGEPYYKIKAILKNPYVLVYGTKIKLNHGMTLTAVITGDKKKIWQWVLDPIYSYYGEQLI